MLTFVIGILIGLVAGTYITATKPEWYKPLIKKINGNKK